MQDATGNECTRRQVRTSPQRINEENTEKTQCWMSRQLSSLFTLLKSL
jgi:hypothetical protein